jgi:crotonobetainyl-CoA:carnitine CoA-transferase CaiB-like acyl-CoA transferase
MLAALGADVLRLDPPWLPELPLSVLDGGPGKRSALLDARTADGRAVLERLLAEADVVVQGYRPGALAAVGLDPARLRDDHPHLVTVTLSAWGHAGPWSGRRGFDSLVQAATGIAVVEGDGATPGALPAQALDHGTGYLIAAAALRGLAERARTGRAVHARVALARTAALLLDHEHPPEDDAGRSTRRPTS